MNKLQEIPYKINLHPSMLKRNISSTLNSLIIEKMKHKIFNSSYIVDILSFKHSNTGAINNDASVSYNVIVCCNTICPQVDQQYSIKITHINKMGILHKFEHVTIFIPLHHLINQSHAIDDTINVKILGKRIEENLVCVAKEI
jgi:DNA-directed RNA polymerase subunit E'/Rpb7